MIEVKVKDVSDEAFAKAYSQFKKLCNKDGFLKEVKEKRYYRKPSEIKRERIRKAKREQSRELEKENKLF